MAALIDPTPGAHGAARGCSLEGPGGRIFGGQVVAQALMAATHLEQDGRQAHNLHASFLRAGDVSKPVDYHATEPFAGRSFATRQVIAMQDGQPILALTASFHRSETGPAHHAPKRTQASPDEALQRLDTWRASGGEQARLFSERLGSRPIEIVPIDPDALFGGEPQAPRTAWWARLRRPLASSPAMHRGLLAYTSDMLLLRNAMLPHAIRPFSPGVQTASLDHAVWFHETPDLSEWLIFETDSPWAGHARGLSRGCFYDQDGRLIASVAQESLMRPTPTKARPPA